MKAQRRTVAVFGGSGFAGRWITRELLQRGFEVDVYARHATEMELRHPRLRLFDLDIRMEKSLPGRGRYTAIINATGRVAGVGYNVDHQAEMLADNFDLMRHAADLAALQSEYFVQLSSACVYANEVAAGAREDQGFFGEPDAANYGYGWGKRMGEIYTATRLRGEHIPFVVLRPFNLYGPGDHYGDGAHVIPALIRKFVHDEVVQVWGDGSQVREFLYVEDLARAVAHAVANRVTGTVNICNGLEHAITIRELVELIEQNLNTGKKVVYGAGGPIGQRKRFGNPEKARALGLASTTPPAEGLQKTISDYLLRKSQPHKVVFAQPVKIWKEAQHEMGPL